MTSGVIICTRGRRPCRGSGLEAKVAGPDLKCPVCGRLVYALGLQTYDTENGRKLLLPH